MWKQCLNKFGPFVFEIRMLELLFAWLNNSKLAWHLEMMLARDAQTYTANKFGLFVSELSGEQVARDVQHLQWPAMGG